MPAGLAITDDPVRPDPPTRWEAVDVAATLDRLAVDPAVGLDGQEAAARLERHGPNRLEGQPGRPAWLLFLDQFKGVIVAVLAGAAVVAGLVGDLKDTIVIAAVLLLNGILGFIQEHRAAQSLDALRAMLAPTARVRRDGVATPIDAELLVPGDVVLLEAGDRIPADGRIVVAASAEVDESALTGESVPVAKQTETLEEASEPDAARAPIGDRTNLAHMNTVVTRGRIELVVTETGATTEMGRLASLLEETEAGPTPLQQQLDALGRRLAAVAGVAVAVFFGLGLLRGQGLADTLLSAVALAVAAIPEGLAAVVTVTLAVGVSQMAKRGAIVKRLPSVETLGCTSVICSDKTGTLTLNQMTPVALHAAGRDFEVESDGDGPGHVSAVDGHGVELAELGEAAALCNDARLDPTVGLVGDPTEGAFLLLAVALGVDPDLIRADRPRIAELPFDSAVKLMATFHQTPSGTVAVIAKGATDRLLPHTPATPAETAEIEAAMEDFASRGQRVLAVASREIDPDHFEAASGDPDSLWTLVEGLTLHGVVGIVDPPRPEARDAIAVAKRAGIAVKMITGDHATTAAAIAADLGIEGRATTGAEVDTMSDDELRSAVEEIGVFARVAPEHKLRIVAALQANGEVVAMTGDGVNDAPALNRADVGVAMGITGTEVSKDAADMILTDDDFSTIVAAVRRGRTIYANIVTFVRFQLGTNLGAIGTLVGAQLLGLPVPFTALQMLWVNTIMDGPPAMTMGVDPPKSGVMSEQPRPRGVAILPMRRLGTLLVNGLVMAVGTLIVLAVADRAGERQHALTMAFTVFVLFQIPNALCARSERNSVFRRDTFTNWKLWTALGGVVLLQIGAVHWGPMQRLFVLVHLSLTDWLIAIAVASSLLWINELRALVNRWSRNGA